MAENKKSFLLYCDIVHTVKKLSNEQAGELFKHILSYVNDEHPVSDNIIVELVFEPIKQQLKRDLIRWESTLDVRQEAGKQGGIKSGEARRLKKQNEANEAIALLAKQNEANEAVTVNVTDTDTVKVIEEETKEELAKKAIENKRLDAIASALKRKDEFYTSLKPYVKTYTQEIVRAFYDYWIELNKSGTKMRFELERTWETPKRLATWLRNEKTSTKTKKEDYNVNELKF